MFSNGLKSAEDIFFEGGNVVKNFGVSKIPIFLGNFVDSEKLFFVCREFFWMVLISIFRLNLRSNKILICTLGGLHSGW